MKKIYTNCFILGLLMFCSSVSSAGSAFVPTIDVFDQDDNVWNTIIQVFSLIMTFAFGLVTLALLNEELEEVKKRTSLGVIEQEVAVRSYLWLLSLGAGVMFYIIWAGASGFIGEEGAGWFNGSDDHFGQAEWLGSRENMWGGSPWFKNELTKKFNQDGGDVDVILKVILK